MGIAIWNSNDSWYISNKCPDTLFTLSPCASLFLSLHVYVKYIYIHVFKVDELLLHHFVRHTINLKDGRGRGEGADGVVNGQVRPGRSYS